MGTDMFRTTAKDAPELNVALESIAVIERERGSSRILTLFRAIYELVKFRITFFVGMSAAFGYILAGGEVSLQMLLPVTGIFLLSCASAATNHYQEIATDAMMHRTSKRPLPSGSVTQAFVSAFILVLAVSGSALTLLTGNLAALIFSWLAFVSYNAVYTPLKKKTPFAVIPGSFVGSFPVMAGWAAAGGGLLDSRLFAVALFFFIWQIPHFWLLMDLYSADYERAGFPTLRLSIKQKSVSIMIYAWTLALALSSVLFITAGVVGSIFSKIILGGLDLWLVAGTYPLVSKNDDKRATRGAFMKINIYVLAATLLVMIDKLMRILVK